MPEKDSGTIYASYTLPSFLCIEILSRTYYVLKENIICKRMQLEVI